MFQHISSIFLPLLFLHIFNSGIFKLGFGAKIIDAKTEINLTSLEQWKLHFTQDLQMYDQLSLKYPACNATLVPLAKTVRAKCNPNSIDFIKTTTTTATKNGTSVINESICCAFYSNLACESTELHAALKNKGELCTQFVTGYEVFHDLVLTHAQQYLCKCQSL